MLKRHHLIITLLSIVGHAQAQFQKCDYSLKIAAVGQTIVVNYPGINQPGTSCRYQIIAPASSIIEASCSFDIAGVRAIKNSTNKLKSSNFLQNQPSCATQKFKISRGGDDDLRDSSVLCGRGSSLQRSIGNEMVVALVSSKLSATSFRCTFKSVAQTNANCDCGWNVRGRIVGGSAAGINEFVSHAGLVDKATKEVFCGAIIRELVLVI